VIVSTDPAGGLLVIGIGSELHGDDAAGRVVAARVEVMQLAGVQVRSMVQLVPELVEDLATCTRVAFVDADPGCAVTTVRDVQAAADGVTSIHHMTPAGLLRLAEAVGVRVPDAVLVGVPAESLSLGCGLSPQTRAGIDTAVAALLQLAAPSTPVPVSAAGDRDVVGREPL
jgi:hydrogenase maturation protease